MFKKILIANRGEIALRIIWACRELGISTVAVYSEADAHSLHVKFADEDVCIGPAPASDSYLNISSILSAAEITGADAVHPGYGFLSESAHFAEVCEACNLTFIGPSPEILRLVGDKVRARQTMSAGGVPVLPGSDSALASGEEVERVADEIGFPLIIKAVAGGGGKGMRVVRSSDGLESAVSVARQEAGASFADDRVYVEKLLEEPRHVEFQIMADNHGNQVHLGERECSIQRRHQKIIEESPSTALTPALREAMAKSAITAARVSHYTNAGTVEFLLDRDGSFYFIEMNARIQVEHPVTEMVTGIDLIKEQIRVAAGETLGYSQRQVKWRGHSIECRINAECPDTFVPSPGLITSFHLPGGPGVRIDTAAHSQLNVSPYYDSMIAKLITHGNDRAEAIFRMRRSLEVMVVEGIKTNIPLHLRIINDPDFLIGRLSTGYLNRLLASGDTDVTGNAASAEGSA
ncbi:MAG: acetyl-CoA carboxylase biotin carboxylase subunit [Acidobacteria bacterium]|nr:acetyl-CoA carboxylase biotin carboxylase subunit [Acidobacteriota bacterium]